MYRVEWETYELNGITLCETPVSVFYMVTGKIEGERVRFAIPGGADTNCEQFSEPACEVLFALASRSEGALGGFLSPTQEWIPEEDDDDE
jgi:hypothetical protein